MVERCFIALFPELDSVSVPIGEKARAVMENIGILDEKDARWALCEIITNPAVPAHLVAKAENLLPEVVGGNVDHEVHMAEEEFALYLHQSKTPP